MIKLARYIITALFLLFIILPSLAGAAEAWKIDNFQSIVDIQSDGKVAVSETVDADFGSLQKHGIFRNIPYMYLLDSGGNTYADIQILGLTQNGLTAKYQQYKQGNYLVLQIGDPNKLISGKQEYQIKYLATGVLRSFNDHDELYWDITGGWPVPITQASAVITLPQDAISQITCFEGIYGSKEPCRQQLISKSKAAFSASRPLQVQEGLTAVVGYSSGLVPILTITPPPASTNYTNITSNSQSYPPNLTVAVLAFILGTAFVFWLWWSKGRELSKGYEATMVEYFPPDKLRPAEVGTLLDERADTLDVSATIIDLAARGFLTIKEEAKKWIFGSTDYILSKTQKDPADLLSYEKVLLNQIFKDGDVVKISQLKNEFYEDLSLVKETLYKAMVDKNFFPTNPEKARNKYTSTGIAILLLGGLIVIVGLFKSEIIGGAGLGIIGAGGILTIFSRSFSRRTPLGHEEYKKILGFKMFVDKAEKYKQQFLERENIFSEVLPYAIVFGDVEKFAKAFEVLGLKPPQPTWYISSQSFNPVLFSSSLNSFSSSITSAIAAQPKSNSFVSSGSGFGGGGFSGGGFGGGGGGSW